MEGSEDYLPLWLELRLGDQSWLFEFRAGDERAVIVGSHVMADVRVAHEGVAATHFHFEREADAIVVVPGYRAALLLNEAAISDPAAIAKQACLDFRGIRLEADVHDVPPLHLLLQARHGQERTRHSRDYFERLPGEADPTVADLRVVSRANPTDEDELDLRTTTALRAVAPVDGFGPFGTVIMQLPPHDEVTPVSARLPELLPATAPDSTERLRLEPWTTTPPESFDTSPTPVDLPRPRGTSTPGCRLSVSPSLAPTAKPAASTHTPSLLDHLGTAASKHPLRLAATALPICLLITLALVGAARLVRETHSPSMRTATSFAALRPSTPSSPPPASTEAAPTVETRPMSRASTSATVATLPSAAATVQAPAVIRRARPAGRALREPKRVFLAE